MSKVFVTGLFKTRAAAEAAVDAIIKRGYTRDDISVLMSDSTKSKEFAVETRSHAVDGLGIGGAIGGTVGAVLAAIVAMQWMGMGILPGGPIVGGVAFLLSVVVHAIFGYRAARAYERQQLISTPMEFMGAKREQRRQQSADQT